MSHARQIILDTETTGLEVGEGHRVIEVGCIELINRRVTTNNFHHYINPERMVDPGALEVHGISNQFLADKPLFADIGKSLFDYLRGAELIIHNAAFDIGFLDMEFARLGYAEKLAGVCGVIDTVAMARRLHPGQKASLDALCKRYGVDNSNRDLHGALLDARLLADVYLAMTGGQAALVLDRDTPGANSGSTALEGLRELLDAEAAPLRVIQADAEELAAHAERLAGISKKSGGKLLWVEPEPPAAA